MSTAIDVLEALNELAQDGLAGGLRGKYTASAKSAGPIRDAGWITKKIVGQTQGRVQGQQMLVRVARESSKWVEKEISLKDLLGPLDPDINHGHVVRSKGAIVVTGDGEILDGRHRAVDAIKRGEKKIRAWVPVKGG